MKILGALLTLSALCLIALPAAAERWDSKTTKDQMTGETQIYVSSPPTRPVRGLGFPYQDVRAWLAVGCNASRSEEHTSELQSLMRISYAVFSLNTIYQDIILSLL